MKKVYLLPLLFLLLADCGSKPAPAWLATGHKQLETYKQDFLSAREPVVAELRFKKAITEIKRSGDLNLLAKALLTRMALQIAVLEAPDEGDFARVESAQPVPANRNFYLFLKGDLADVDGDLLPSQYRPFLMAFRRDDTAGTGKAVAGIKDPLSRLIAAGLSVTHHIENETILLATVEAASENGWKRALLVWLKRLQSSYEASNEPGKADLIRRRIGIIEK